MKSRGCLIAGVVLGGVAVLAIGLFLWGTGVYNRLVKLDEGVAGAWSQVESQYQRRADLIPNLVETVKGFAKQEKDVLIAVTEARAKVSQITVTKEVLEDPAAFQKFQQAQDQFSSAHLPVARGVRKLSAVEVERKLPRPADAARGDREPHRGRAAAVQPGRSELQHRHPRVPCVAHCRVHGVQAEGVLPGERRCGRHPGGEVLI